MSVWRDMAHDGGYRGDEAEHVARMLEEQERAKYEAELEARYLEELEAAACICSPGGWRGSCPVHGIGRAASREEQQRSS